MLFVMLKRDKSHGAKKNKAEKLIANGLVISSSSGDNYIIHYRRTGMGCMNFFLLVWLIGWTVVCVFLLQAFLAGGTMDDGAPIPFWFVLIFWSAEIGVAAMLAYMLFGRKIFRLDRNSITIETNVLGFKRRKTIRKDSIECFVQVRDGGEGEDSFPSWGLKAECGKKVTLIFRQPYEKSHRLGQFLAQWADVEFHEASERES